MHLPINFTGVLLPCCILLLSELCCVWICVVQYDNIYIVSMCTTESCGHGQTSREGGAYGYRFVLLTGPMMSLDNSRHHGISYQI